jgi:hypothetical protein
MKTFLSALCITAACSVSVLAAAQDVPSIRVTSFYKLGAGNSSLHSGSLSCGAYGCNDTYIRQLIPTSLEAAQYIASLPVGRYDCDAYYGVYTDSGAKIFSPEIVCVSAR